jgi:hypothetical protein
MMGRRVSAFVDALAAGRRPRRFRARPDDVDVLNTAITLRAARPGEAAPTDTFVENLFERLSTERSHAGHATQPLRTHRARAVLIATAAAAVLVAATAVATESIDHSTTTAIRAPHGSALRTGTFQAPGGVIVGQIVAYHGDPSWVFMKVDVPGYNGTVKCMLQVDNGSTVAFGTFAVHAGAGQFSKTIRGVDISHLRGAKLVTPSGSPVGDATFA